MKTAKSIQGRWWLFGENRPWVPGELHFDPETGLILEAKRFREPNLMGALGQGPFNCPKVIKGTDSRGKAITLFGCAASRTNYALALDSYTIMALRGLIGAHFENLDEAIFSKTTVDYSILDAWLLRPAITSIETTTPMPAFALQPHPDIKVFLPNAELIISTNFSAQNELRSTTLSYSQTVQFVTKNHERFHSILDNYVRPFSRLLSLLANTTTYADEIQFEQSPDSMEQIELLSATRGIRAAKRSFHPNEWLLPYHIVANTLEHLIVNWFAYHDLIEPVLNLYFLVVDHTNLPSETRFLLLAQALEVYHSRSPRFDGKIQPTFEFQKRRKTVINLVPPSEQKWLDENLQFANQKRLSMRLNELIEEQKASIGSFISDPVEFANVVRWTRNYLTHYSQDEEDRVERGAGRIAQGAELIARCSQMQALLELLFIADLKLPASAVQQIINRAKQLRVISV